ncbi:MAG: fibronectin [archaeon]
MINLKKQFASVAFFLTFISVTVSLAQVDENERRYFRVGSLQSHINAYGATRAWNLLYYEGLRWPADYLRQDNSVIDRHFFSVKDFTDAKGVHWDTWASGISLGYVNISLFPVKLKQYAKFELPIVYVDGVNISAPYASDVDALDLTQIPDRVIVNQVNTSIGLTINIKYSVFSQGYHDNYLIKEYTFTNTGFVTADSVVVLTDTLRDFRFGGSTRYQCGREGAERTDAAQTYGKYSWVTVRGEDYPDHVNDILTEADGPVEWIRSAFSWFGKSDAASVTWDNVGAPLRLYDGRLMSPHFVGTGILHVDKSPTDHTDDPYQPATLGWHAGDIYPGCGDLKDSDRANMARNWDFIAGIPSGSSKNGATSIIGTDDHSGRMWEKFTNSDPIKRLTDTKSPWTIHGDGGGTGIWVGFGPYDLAHGESVTIVQFEAVNGLSREKCFEIGRNWKKCVENPNTAYTFKDPDGVDMTAKFSDGSADLYKNLWVYTGMDSILLTISRAKRNYDSGFNIPQPPLPPAMFDVQSGGDRIFLKWAPSPNELDGDFAGYRVYRACGKPDTSYQIIADVAKNVHEFADVTAVRGFSYYYYLTAYNDGSNNSSGVFNPKGILESGRFYTKTNQPAYLQRPQGKSMKDIRVVPNPFIVSAQHLQFLEEDDKLMFYNIPGKCDIKIFTESGELIETIHHISGTGDEKWKSLTSSRQVIVSGIYIAYIEVTEDCKDLSTGEVLFKKGDHTTRKIIVIR